MSTEDYDMRNFFGMCHSCTVLMALDIPMDLISTSKHDFKETVLVSSIIAYAPMGAQYRTSKMSFKITIRQLRAARPCQNPCV